MANSNPKYDAAISFLVQDIGLATALHDKLREGLEVFFFPRNQEDLAGTDGLESMRESFRNESRLNVFLYRPKWGNTPWTAVEAAAIKDSCLDTGFKSLFFFVIDPTKELPKWLPETHVRFNLSDFSIDQAVGAIKMRVQERGGHYQPLTPVRKAEQLKAQEEFRRDKARMSSSDGIARIFSEVEKLFAEIGKQCDDANSAGHVQIRHSTKIQMGNVDQSCTITGGRVSVVVFWHQLCYNSIEDSFLGIREFNECLLIPPGNIFLQQPEVIGEKKFSPDLSTARQYGWQLLHGSEAFVSSEELACKCVLQLLDLIDRDGKGKVRRKGWN